jgi:hypothetical protein
LLGSDTFISDTLFSFSEDFSDLLAQVKELKELLGKLQELRDKVKQVEE